MPPGPRRRPNVVQVYQDGRVVNSNGTQTAHKRPDGESSRLEKSTGDSAPGTFGISAKWIEAGENPRRRLAEKLAKGDSGSLVAAYVAQRRRKGTKGY